MNVKRRFLCFLLAFLLIPCFSLAETKVIITPFDMSCNIFMEYLQLTMGNDVDDNAYAIEEGIFLMTETSNILIMYDDTPILPRVKMVSVSAKPSKYDHPSDCAADLTGDAIAVYRALTKCKSSDIKELFDTFLSLGIVDSTMHQTAVESKGVIYEDCLVLLDADYAEDHVTYIIMKNPYVEKPKFKEFENNTEGEQNQ